MKKTLWACSAILSSLSDENMLPSTSGYMNFFISNSFQDLRPSILLMVLGK
jgi:hypothetical protein